MLKDFLGLAVDPHDVAAFSWDGDRTYVALKTGAVLVVNMDCGGRLVSALESIGMIAMRRKPGRKAKAVKPRPKAKSRRR